MSCTGRGVAAPASAARGEHDHRVAGRPSRCGRRVHSGARRPLGDAGRRNVEREYSAAVVARRREALFDEVLVERDYRRLV
jgi:hypothetical protein